MSRRLVGTLGIWLLACAVLAAADFWEEKDFITWSDDEVEKMLTDSPWSQKVTVVVRGRGGGGGGRGGGGRGGGGAANLGGRGGGRRNHGFNDAPPRMALTVSWRSALPVKQAVVRGQIGIDARMSADQQLFLAQQEPLYVVSVSGFPLQFTRMTQDGTALAAQTILKRDDHDPIPAEHVEVFVGNDETVILEYAFSRDDAIILDDKDVEFITTVGQIEVKRKFKLQDMVFVDHLAL